MPKIIKFGSPNEAIKGGLRDKGKLPKPRLVDKL